MGKALELLEIFQTSFGVLIVGGAGVGKSACLRLLADSGLVRTTSHSSSPPKTINIHHINPMSLTSGELFGELDTFTREWQ